MDTYEVEIIEPKAKRLLDDLAELKLITFRPSAAAERFAQLREKIRKRGENALTLDEIIAEVESVRAERLSRTSNDPNSPDINLWISY